MSRYLIWLLTFLSFATVPAFSGGTLTTLGAGPGNTESALPPIAFFTEAREVCDRGGTSGGFGTCTASNVDIGFPSPDRYVVLVASASTFNSATTSSLGTLDILSDPFNGGGRGIWGIAAPTGTTANFTITGSNLKCWIISVYVVYNSAGNTVTEFGGTNSNTTQTFSATTGSGNPVIALAPARNTGSINPTITLPASADDADISCNVTNGANAALATKLFLGTGVTDTIQGTYTGSINFFTAVTTGISFQ